MLEWLQEAQLQWLVDFVCNAATGVPVDVLVHGDFCALPAKTTHGPMGNSRPFLNFTTTWKLIGAHIADQYVWLVAQAGPLPFTQLALHASSSVADLLRDLHAFKWFRCFR